MTIRRPNAAIRKVTRLHDGFLRLNEYLLDIETHAGERVTRTWLLMERGNAVAVLGYDPARDLVVLVNEVRPGALAAGDDPFSDALVAGGMGPDESVFDAAMREMREETNLELRQPRIVHPGLYSSPGGTSEKVAIVLGLVDSTRAGGVHGNPAEGEDIKTVILPAEQFIARARSGAITDMKTVLAGYWLAEHRAALRAGAGA